MITVYQAQGSNVPPLVDARLYELLSGGGVGVVLGCEITSLGGLQLRIGSGWLLFPGRCIAIEEETITVTPSTGSQVDGQLILHLDVSSEDTPGTWVTNAETPLPAPVQEDINGSGTIYEMQMCAYKVDRLQVTGLQTTFPVLGTAASYLYKATFDVDGWTPGSGTVTQTATLVPVDGGPPVTSGSTLLACKGTDSTLPQETKDAMSSPAGDIAKASKALGDNTITVTLPSAPDVDVEIYFSIKQGVEPAVPPLDPVGSGNVVYIGSALGTQSVSYDFSSAKYSAYILIVRNSQPGTLWTWNAIVPARTIRGQSNVTVYFGGQQQGGGYIVINTTAKTVGLALLQNYDGTTITGNGALDVYGIRM